MTDAPPYNVDAERAVLGAILLNAQVLPVVRRTLESGRTFFDPAHRIIYDACLSLHDAGKSVDVVTLASIVDSERVNILTISELTDAVPTSANAEHYANIVLEYHNRRQLVRIASNLKERAYHDDPNAIVNELQGQLFNLTHHDSRVWGTAEMLEEYRAAADADSTQVRIRFGIPAIDNVVNVQSDYLIVVAARPKTGKTRFMLSTAWNIAMSGATPLIFSLEMSHDRLSKCLIATSTPEDVMVRASKGHVTTRAALGFGEEAMKGLDFRIVDSEITVEGVCSLARHMVSLDPNISCVMIDYINLLQNTKGMTNEYEAINYALSHLVALKKQIKRPIILLAQLKRRGTDSFGAGAPTMDEIKGSGLIEQSADVICLMWAKRLEEYEQTLLDERYGHNTIKRVRMNIVQRDGPEAQFSMLFNTPHCRFKPWEHIPNPEENDGS